MKSRVCYTALLYIGILNVIFLLYSVLYIYCYTHLCIASQYAMLYLNLSNVLAPKCTFLHRGVRKTNFFAFRRFSILVKSDRYATLYKSLSAWAEALKA